MSLDQLAADTRRRRHDGKSLIAFGSALDGGKLMCVRGCMDRPASHEHVGS
jgi:hypothetical protein